MSDLVLRLFFQGLIAFVPSDPGAPGASVMTAYVMKDAGHLPALTFEMKGNSVCPQSEGADSCQDDFESKGLCCKVVKFQKGSELLSSWCTCYLGSEVKISFKEPQLGIHKKLKSKPDGARPQRKGDVADFSWLVQMSTVQGGPVRVDQSKLAKNTRAEMKFSWLAEQSCQLDQEGGPKCHDTSDSDCDYKIHSFYFKASSSQSNHQQAVAEYSMFELRFPFSPEIVLEHTGKKIFLDLGCDSKRCPDVMVENLMTGDSDDAGIGYHFDKYYDIAEGTPIRYIPYRNEGDYLDLGPRQLNSCLDDPFKKQVATVPQKATERLFKDGRKVSSRIVCPMVMFDP